MANKQDSSGGIGFAGLLTVVFIVLKLTGIIDWSWVWVLAPLWISVAVGFAVLGLVGLMVGVISLVALLVDR